MSRGAKSKTESIPSSMLNLQENERLEELLGRRCAVSPELGEMPNVNYSSDSNRL